MAGASGGAVAPRMPRSRRSGASRRGGQQERGASLMPRALIGAPLPAAAGPDDPLARGARGPMESPFLAAMPRPPPRELDELHARVGDLESSLRDLQHFQAEKRQEQARVLEQLGELPGTVPPPRAAAPPRCCARCRRPEADPVPLRRPAPQARGPA
jgi:hypothetical protein